MKYLTSLIQTALDGFKNLNYCFHYEKPASFDAPYAVWQEQMEESFHSDNSKSERSLQGVVDYYTQTENDPNLDSIEIALDSMKAAWSLTSVQFESETELIHFTWDWSIQ